jgi:hypothetical protein
MSSARSMETKPQAPRAQRRKAKGDAPSPPWGPDTPAEQHGAERAASAFSLRETVSEYRVLRASVLRLWRRRLVPGRTRPRSRTPTGSTRRSIKRRPNRSTAKPSSSRSCMSGERPRPSPRRWPRRRSTSSRSSAPSCGLRSTRSPDTLPFCAQPDIECRAVHPARRSRVIGLRGDAGGGLPEGA